MVSDQDVQKLCKLSRLNAEKEDIQGLKKHLEGMISHMEELRELDLSDVEPLTRLDDSPSVLREDVVKESLSKEDAFKNTKFRDLDHFQIPKVIG